MSLELRQRLFEELDSLVLIDPHTHINALQPASTTLADILGYHYYTELAHSAGMPRERIEEPGLDPEGEGRPAGRAAGADREHDPVQLADRDAAGVLRLCRRAAHAGELGRRSTTRRPRSWASPIGRSRCWSRAGSEAVFLTNDFDDPLEGFDTQVYIPCLRTDDLVFHLAKPQVRERLEQASRTSVSDAASLRTAIGRAVSAFRLARMPRPAPFRCRPTSRRRSR